MSFPEEQSQARNKTMLWAAAVSLLLANYVFSYVILSKQGRYEPAAFGMNGIKWWEWAPRGYPGMTEDRSPWLPRIYRPLWLIDIRFWHDRSHTGESGYPITQWVESPGPPGFRTINP